MTEDYYTILGITDNASGNDIKTAFRKLVKQYHPDSQYAKENPDISENQFLKIKEAYEVLSDNKKRLHYDLRMNLSGDWRLSDRFSEKARNYYNEGRRLYKKRLYEKAAMHFRNAVEIDRRNALYCSWLGLSLLEQKDQMHEAKRWCERATALEPSNADYQINLALVYREAGIHALSLKHTKRALLLDPSNDRARLWLKRLDGNDGQTASLVKRIKNIFRIKRGSV